MVECQRERMAFMLGFSQDKESWPTGTLDRLISLEEAKGHKALIEEIAKMCNQPEGSRVSKQLFIATVNESIAKDFRIAALEAELEIEKELTQHMAQAHSDNLRNIGDEFAEQKTALEAERDRLQAELATANGPVNKLTAALADQSQKVGKLEVELSEANLKYASVNSLLQKERRENQSTMNLKHNAERKAKTATRLLEEQRVRTLGVIGPFENAASELAQYASYAEIVGGVSVNKAQIRKWCDEVFRLDRALATELEAGK